MGFFENTRKPQGLGGKIMVKMMNKGHSKLAKWGFTKIYAKSNAKDDLALHNIQLQNELTNYQRSQVAVEVVIHKNLYYKNSPLYKKIQRDVERFLKIIK